MDLPSSARLTWDLKYYCLWGGRATVYWQLHLFRLRKLCSLSVQSSLFSEEASLIYISLFDPFPGTR